MSVKLKVRKLAVFVVILLSFGVFTYHSDFFVARAAWYDNAWTHRKPIAITNGNGSTLTDFQVQVIVPYDSDMQAGFGDIRFTSSNGTTLLDYWGEYIVASTSAVFWVQVPSLPSGSSTIYMYYGNAGAITTASGDNTFEFYDGFLGPNFDTWTRSSFSTGNSIRILGSGLRITEYQNSHANIRKTFSGSFVDKSVEGLIIYSGAAIGEAYHPRLTVYQSPSVQVGVGPVQQSVGTLPTDTLRYYNNGAENNISASDYNSPDRVILRTTFTASQFTVATRREADTAWIGNATSAYTTSALDNASIVIGKRPENDDFDQVTTAAHTWRWVRVRKSAAVEPTFLIGSEEILNQFQNLDVNVSVNNVAPEFASGTDVYETPISDSSNPTNETDNITFSAMGDEHNNDDMYLAICKTNAITPQEEGSPPNCDNGSLCTSSATVEGNPLTCTYDPGHFDEEVQEWYAFICDVVGGTSECSSSNQGTLTDGSESPIVINHTPDFTAMEYDGGSGPGSPAEPGGTVTFTATASDIDVDGPDDTVKLVVCEDDSGATASGCLGSQLCQSSLTPSDPTCDYEVPSIFSSGPHDFYAYVFDSHDLGSTNNPTVSTYDIATSDPGVSNLALNNGEDIDLLAESTRTVLITATVTDANSCEDVTSVEGFLYRSGIAQSGCDEAGEEDDNNCYPAITCTVVGSGNTCTGPSDASASYECSVEVQFHADPTEINTQFPAENWLATVVATDNTLATDNLETATGVEMLTLVGVALSGDISYGEFNPGQNTGSTNQTVTLTNTGNVGLDILLSGTDLDSSSTVIPVDNQEYALAPFTYGAGTSLSASATEIEINILKTLISVSPEAEDTYWGIAIPIGTQRGTYSGTNTFTGVLGEIIDW